MTEKLRLDLPLVLPDISNAADACVARLLDDLRGRDGIAEAHVRTIEGKPAELCVHYDSDIIPLPRIRALVSQSGASLTERYGHIAWEVEGITHERRARTIADRLGRLPGVLEAHASGSGMIALEFDRNATSESAIRQAMNQMGLRPRGEAGAAAAKLTVPSQRTGDSHDHEVGHGGEAHVHGEGEDRHDHAHGGIFGPRTEMIFALLCGAILGIGFAAETIW